MISRYLIFIVLFSISLCSFGATQYYRLSYRDDPATTVVIGWCDKGTSTNAKVYFGTTDFGKNYQNYPYSKSIDRTESSFKGLNHRFARLTGLEPDSLYYFVVKDDQDTSARMMFKTLPDNPETPLTFIAGGDSRTGFFGEFEYSQTRPRRQTGNMLVARIRPDFIAFSGDFVFSVPPIPSSSSDWQDWLEDWQLTISSDGQLFPLIPTFGNHEESADVYKLFDIPNSNTYYSLGIGGNLLRIYTLNSEIECDSTQRSWLENDLQLHTNNTLEPYWKFAQYHYPFVPHSNYEPNTALINCWTSLFESYKVRLVSEAHAHIIKLTWPILTSSASGSDNGFIRNDSLGIVYIGEGSWGAPMRDLYTYYSANAAYNWTRNQEKMPGFHVVCVNKETIEVRTIKFENLANVGQNSMDEPPCTLPDNIVVWNPGNGDVVTLANPAGPHLSVNKDENFSNQLAVISPNPASGVFEINFLIKNLDVKLELYDALGRQIKADKIRSNEIYSLDLKNQSAGVYFLYLHTGNTIATYRIYLQH